MTFRQTIIFGAVILLLGAGAMFFFLYPKLLRAKSLSSSQTEKLEALKADRDKLVKDTLRLAEYKQNLIRVNATYIDSLAETKERIGKTLTVIRYIHLKPYSATELDSIFYQRYGRN